MNQTWHMAHMMARCMIRVKTGRGGEIASDIERLKAMYAKYTPEVIARAEQICSEKIGGTDETVTLGD